MEEKNNGNDAILSIFAGTGGKDAEDWASILLRMYQKYLFKKNFKIKEIARVEGEGGIKSVTIEIKKEKLDEDFIGVFDFFKKESGVHRLVRISPFSSKSLRHTSFALVEVLPKIREKEINLKKEELKIETFRASGPGGQYVNRRESAVRIVHLPTGISATCQSERLQGENKRKALAILQAKLNLLSQREKEEKVKKEKGEFKIAQWGNQIRSYIFHPYQMVKDHRTKIKTSNLQGVLNGDLDKFIKAELH